MRLKPHDGMNILTKRVKDMRCSPLLCEDGCTNQEEGTHKEQNVKYPDLGLFSLQNYEKKGLCKSTSL
jgi:hypothetical protein